MNVNYEMDEDVLIAYLEGDIDHHSVQYFRTSIDNMISVKRPKLLVLDLKSVGFTDSSGIALIVGRYKEMITVGGRTQVVNSCRQVKKILAFSGLERLVKIS